MHVKSTQISVTTKNLKLKKKTSKIMHNYLKNALKNLQTTLLLNTPSGFFYFRTKSFGACKKKEKQNQINERWYQDMFRLKIRTET